MVYVLEHSGTRASLRLGTLSAELIESSGRTHRPDMQHAGYEVDLDATEATLNAIEEQLESGSPIMQAEGAHKVTAQHISSTRRTCELPLRVASPSTCASCHSFGVCPEMISSTRQRRGLDCFQQW